MKRLDWLKTASQFEGSMRITILLLAGLAGCTQSNKDYSSEIALIRSELSSVKHDLDLERRRGVDSNGRIQKLEASSPQPADIALIDPAGPDTFQRINTNLTPILVAFYDSSPVGDGTKIKLQIGNISSATMDGIKLRVQYNVRAPQDSSKIGEWNARARNQNVDLVDRLGPGTWTTVSASLPGIKPDELGFLAVSAELGGVSLRVAN
jgi:hypothetical protein